MSKLGTYTLSERPIGQYVYFDDLWKTESGSKYAQRASNYLYQLADINTGQTLATAQQNINIAFQWLDKIISQERAKENQFIQHLINKTKGKINIDIPTSNQDWSEFVKTVQKILTSDGLNGQLARTQKELIRLQQNDARQTQAYLDGKGSIYGSKTISSQVTDYLEGQLKYLTTDNNSQSRGKIITDFILNKYGSRLASLITTKNNTIAVDQGHLLALIQTISGLIAEDYAVHAKENLIYGREKNFDYNDFLSKQLAENGTDEQIERLLDNIENNPYLLEDLKEAYGFDKIDNKKLTKEDKNFFSQVSSHQAKIDDILPRIKNIYKDYIDISKKNQRLLIKASIVGNVQAEISSLVTHIISGALVAQNTGSTGAKPDNVIGYLDLDWSELLQSSNPHKAQQLVMDIRNLIKELNSGLKSKNTTEYYQERAKTKENIIRQINQKIEELKQLNIEIGKCYIIEDSTKNYESLYTQSGGSGFHGGSLGPNLTDQIQRITDLANAQGFNQVDAQWLITAIINTGSNHIGKNQKNALEQYLAFFAAVMLFDDQINLVNEALQNNTLLGSSVETIHLFSLDGSQYPLSYVLQLTKINLEKKYLLAESEIKVGKGAEVHITGQLLSYNDGQTWETVAAEAKASTKLKITFLTGFMNTLNSLLGPP